MVIFSLTLVRHGETAHNKQNVIQGQLDVPLSSVGLEQAQKLGTHLQHQKYTHVYSSDLIRAKSTAENILKQSQVCDVTIIEDKKLRERKFGVIEGKSFKFLKEAAKKSNQSVLHMTPQGAETVHEVQARAHSFFGELCQLMKNTAAESLQEKKTKCQDNLTNLNAKTNGASSTSVRGKRKREDISDNCHNNHFPNGLEENSKILLLQEKSSTLQQNHCDKESLENSCLNDPGCDRQCASTHSSECLDESASQQEVAPTFSDEAIRSHLTPCKCETEDSDCPNVSLSPLVTQTSSSKSSSLVTDTGTSSNIPALSLLMPNNSNPTVASMSLLKTRDFDRERRTSVCSSNDENESSLDVIGNVLVVSHGGLLKELILYFVEKLGCSVPGGKKQAMRISPNAGLSKFTVSLADSEDEAPKIICHQIHDKHHLSELGENIYDGSQLTAENTAL